MEKKEVVIDLHKFQDQALFAPERFVAIISGIRGGKTTAGALWTGIQVAKYPGENGLIVAPTYKSLQQAALPTFFKYNPTFKQYYHETKSLIELPTGGTIFIRSMEDPDCIEGLEARYAWMDEAGRMKHLAWVNVQGRVSIKQGPVLLTTTSEDMGWLYSDFYENWKKGDKDYKVVQFRSIDNPSFPLEEYERAKRTMDPRLFNRRYNGQFEKMSGLVYQDFDQGRHVFDELPEEFDDVIAGVDWGFKAPTAITVFGYKDDTFYLITEWYKTDKIQSEIEEVALALQTRYNIKRWYPDNAEQDRIESFRRKGLYCVEVNKDITWGIDKVSSVIRENRLKVHRSCINFLDEIERYHYPEEQEGKAIKDDPVKIDDHAMDSMRYPIATFEAPRRNRANRVLVYKSSSPGY